MPDLTASQLEAIQRLLTDPLRETVRTEMQAGHERLALAIDNLATQFAADQHSAQEQSRSRSARVELLERRVVVLERFRGRVLIVYTALTVLFTFAWSFVREWLVFAGRRK